MPHILNYMSIDFRKFIKILPPEFGGKDKKEKWKKSGNMGFKEFPRPLIEWNGGKSILHIGSEKTGCTDIFVQ